MLALSISLQQHPSQAHAAGAVVATDNQPFHLVGPKQHYLALGDSLAFGYQPNKDFTHGYVPDLFQTLQNEGTKDVTNYACPGETSSTLINDVKGFGIIVDVFTAFGGPGVPNYTLCADTWMCPSSQQAPDIHPTNAGYQVIANTFEGAILNN
jgi:lysophospholipase L1-like esterase